MLCCAPWLVHASLSTVAPTVLELASQNWTLRNANGSIAVPASVPGVVHLDLLQAGIIPEPYYRYGELELAWVHLEPHWTYSLIFDSASVIRHKEVLLRSEGLDTVATVTLNGKVLSLILHLPSLSN